LEETLGFPSAVTNCDEPHSCNSRPSFREINTDKILVIGLGQLGLPVAKYVKDRGFDVYGYDISTKALERAEKTAGIKKAINFSGFDVYIICVSTHKQEDMFSPQIDGILSIVQDKISKEAKNGALVAIESTIPKGTSKKVFEMLNHRLHVAHAPHRWYALEEKEHGVNQLRVVGGVCDCCLRVAMQFYDGSEKSSFSLSPQSSSSNELESQSDIEVGPMAVVGVGGVGGVGRVGAGAGAGGAAEEKEDSAALSLSRNEGNTDKKTCLGIPMHPVPDIEIAELTKIIENAHRYLQIAFAEDLYLYCQANNINFAELRDSLNTKWNVNILEPREGIGGHCLPKDTKMFLNSSKSIKSKILEVAIQIDEDYKKYRQTKETRLCKYAASASKTICQKC
jgi:UDP-N-acetyl-D-mannosaminuronic acid dehydrogenase